MDIARFDLPRYLSVLPLFGAMPAASLQRLAAASHLRRMGRSDMVFRVGEDCEALHITVTGQIKLFAVSPTGQEKVIELVGPGNSFAEALVFSGEPYAFNAQTLTETLLMTVTRSAVRDEIAHDPDFALRMLNCISRRLQGLVRDVESYSLHSGFQRVVNYLLHERDGDCGCGCGCGCTFLSLPATKAMVASRLSLTPEYFSRVLHELVSADLIEVHRRDIRILDTQRLASYQPTM